jgi:hypothetical protein
MFNLMVDKTSNKTQKEIEMDERVDRNGTWTCTRTQVCGMVVVETWVQERTGKTRKVRDNGVDEPKRPGRVNVDFDTVWE